MIFLRLVPLRPVVLNLRMFSRLRLIFSFLALVRQANKGSTAEVVRERLKWGAKAYSKSWKKKVMVENRKFLILSYINQGEIPPIENH